MYLFPLIYLSNNLEKKMSEEKNISAIKNRPRICGAPTLKRLWLASQKYVKSKDSQEVNFNENIFTWVKRVTLMEINEFYLFWKGRKFLENWERRQKVFKDIEWSTIFDDEISYHWKISGVQRNYWMGRKNHKMVLSKQHSWITEIYFDSLRIFTQKKA